MQPTLGGDASGRWWTTLLASLGLALGIFLLLLAGSTTTQAAAPTATLTLNGTVTVAGSGASPADGALVVALGPGASYSTTVDALGSYSLTLTTGRWVVSVRPPVPSLSSPTWIYTGTPQLVGVGDPTTGQSRTLDFVVAAASATISGRVLAPDGSTDFAAPNQAYIWAGNQEGQGTSVQVDPVDGTFAARVLPGNNAVRLALENLQWSPPITLAGSIFFVDANQTTTIELQTISKTATVSGTVRDLASGLPAGDVPVRAWRADGAEVVNGVSASDGSYILPLQPGVWSLRADPAPRSGYVPAEPPKTVVLTTGETLSRTLLVATADITVEGRIVNLSGTQVVSVASGAAYALYRDGDLPRRGPGTSIVGGRFRLRLSSQVASAYQVRAYLDPASGYTALAPVDLPALTPGQTIPISIPVAADSSTISGTFRRKDNGQPQTSIPGSVFARSNGAGSAWTRLNPATGSYSLSVATTNLNGQGGSTWYLRAFVDPSTGFVVQRPRRQAVFLPYNNGQGSSATADFVVAPIDSQIEGLVLAPRQSFTGTVLLPVPGARVVAREQVAPGEVPFTRWVHADRFGRFRMRVAAGSYDVQAFIRRDGPNDRLLAPEPQRVTVSAAQPATAVTLTFREAAISISGTVTLSGSGQAALVRAYSASGAAASTLARPDGRYLLRVTPDDTWYLQAVTAITSSDATTLTFYRSQRLQVATGTSSVGNQELVLELADRLPWVETFAFEGAESQELTLSDGSQIQIPAGALALSGTVYLRAAPLPDLVADGGAQPISFGYRLQAFDQRGMPINRFDAPITLVLPFTNEQLAALGVSAEQLVPQYWDEASWSWKPVEDVVVTVSGDGGSVSFVVEHFTDYALLAEPGRSLFIPFTLR